MSAVIPYDLLPAISAYFFTKQQRPCVQPSPTPTVLHLPRQLRLDCLMPVPVLPVPLVPMPLPPLPMQVQAPAPAPARAAPAQVAPPSTSTSTRRSAFSHAHPHHPHPALVIPPAALRADLTTDDPTPPPLAPGQIIPLLPPLALAPGPLAPLAPTHVPLPPSPVDNTRSDESETKINRHNTPLSPEPGPEPEPERGARPNQLLLSSTTTSATATAAAKPSQEVLEAIEEAASSTLPIPIPIPISILPPSPPTPSLVIPQQQHGGRRSTAPLQPLTNGIIHNKHGNGNGNGNAVSAKGRSGGSVNPIFVKGTPTHPILNGVPSTPFPTDKEFAAPPPLPMPTHGNGNGSGNGNGNGSENRRRPMVVHGPLIGNLLLSSCPGKKGA